MVDVSEPTVAMSRTAPTDGLDPDRLIACPTCDALQRDMPVPAGANARCHRCGTILMAPREGAMTRIVMLAATALVLMVAAVFFPFLEISAGGMVRRSSLLDAVLAFSTGMMLPLTFAVAALIIVLPVIRLSTIVYALAPMALGWHPAKHAVAAFRVAQALRPWAMAEIFIVGVSVALVKVAGLAKLSFGPAFWTFAVLVLVTVLSDNYMCRLTVWKTLEERRK
ncbi:MAG: paraquat-inducible protein A [Paracoccaceae bacterium]|uniref:paraquat-inducible protein A n=1 Tax=Seohaeicola saemankumensis TaxID=481181 RepID=UPI001E4F469E|nr:paraquat-inducible protein A [Seohaeicola saemankumensis]